MALMSVAEALGPRARGRRRRCRRDACRSRTRTAACSPADRRRAAHAAAGRRLGHGRLCGARRRRRDARRRGSRSSARSRPAIRSRARSAPARRCASSPAAGAGRRRHDRDPGEHDARRRRRRRQHARAAPGRHIRARRPRFRAAARCCCAQGRRLTDRDLALAAAMNHRDAAGAPPAQGRGARDRRRARAAGQRRPAPARSSIPTAIAADGAGAPRRLRGRSISASCPTGSRRPSRRSARAREPAPISWSPPAAPRSATTTSCSRRSRPRASRCRSGRSRCGPGKPMMHGRLGAMHVLGLPGNPVSAYVCAVLFLVPLIRAAGRPRATSSAAPKPALLGCDLPANDERADYLRATLAPGPDGAAGRDAAARSRTARCWPPLAEADCLLVREPHAPARQGRQPLRHP